MNRKAQFWSLTGVLLVILLVILFQGQQRVIEEQQEFRVSRAQVGVLDSFARNFETLDVPQMLSSSSRIALIDMSAESPPYSAGDFADRMRTGISPFSTDEQFDRIVSGLAFADPDDMEFTYVLADAEQTAPDTFTLTFAVDYTIESNGQRWSVSGKEYAVEVETYGMMHPVYDGSGVDPVVDDGWTPGTGTCLIDELLSSSSGCTGQDLQPVIIT